MKRFGIARRKEKAGYMGNLQDAVYYSFNCHNPPIPPFS
jgi:hypothetical protein